MIPFLGTLNIIIKTHSECNAFQIIFIIYGCYIILERKKGFQKEKSGNRSAARLAFPNKSGLYLGVIGRIIELYFLKMPLIFIPMSLKTKSILWKKR